MKCRVMFGNFAAAQAVFFLGQHDNRAAFRRFIREAGELSGVRQFAVAHSLDGDEFDRLPVAKRDGSGLVEKQRVHVAGSLNRFSAHGQNVVLHHAIHSGDADRGKQSADGRGDQAHQQEKSERRRWEPYRRRRLELRTLEYGGSVATASRKINVRPAIRMFRAISLGVFWRTAPSTRAIMRSRKVSPGFDVIRILM